MPSGIHKHKSKMYSYDQLGAGARLQSERLKLGLTAEGLCQQVGLDILTYQNYEAGLVCPSVDHFFDLLEVKINLGYVVFGVEREDSLNFNYALILNECADLAERFSQRYDFVLTPAMRIMTALIAYERVMGAASEWQNSVIANRAGFPPKIQS